MSSTTGMKKVYIGMVVIIIAMCGYYVYNYSIEKKTDVFNLISEYDKTLLKNTFATYNDNERNNKAVFCLYNNNNIHSFILRNNTIFASITLEKISNEDRKINWNMTQRKGEYSLLVGYIADDNIKKLNIGGLVESDYRLIDYLGGKVFYTTSENVTSPISIQGISEEGEIIYESTP